MENSQIEKTEYILWPKSLWNLGRKERKEEVGRLKKGMLSILA
jgi:hypothetical protein